jgi:Zn-dependent peptidase ImmA (M78 family)
MSMRVDVNPALLQWACERAGVGVDALTGSFARLPDWLVGEAKPTFKQLEDFAKATHTPFGYFFLPQPPEERLPIPDFRTVSDAPLERPSANLLDTIYAMQRRQALLRELLVEGEAEALAFVGSARLEDQPEAIASEMRRLVGLEDGWAASVRSWQDGVLALRRAIEELGVMAIINGVVGNNTHRVLHVEEFRGFALSDPYAPLIFVNGADAKAGQMFTLAHELAHLWLGEAGVSGFEGLFPRGTKVETWCNQAAAEFLVPERALRDRWNEVRRSGSPFETLAGKFKASPIVVARRALDLRLIGRDAFFAFYEDYTKRELQKGPRGSGGDFYKNQNTRVGALFARQVVRAALEGRIGFKEAYDVTGLNGGAFQEYASRLGVPVR